MAHMEVGTRTAVHRVSSSWSSSSAATHCFSRSIAFARNDALARSQESTYTVSTPLNQGQSLIQASCYSTSMLRLAPTAFVRQGVLRLRATTFGVDTPRGRAP